MTQPPNHRAIELAKLRAELVARLELFDFRSESVGLVLAELARHVERTLRRIAA
jgi:hypothetical protein